MRFALLLLSPFLLSATVRDGNVGLPTIRAQLGTTTGSPSAGGAAPVQPRFRRSNLSGESCGGSPPTITDAGTGAISGVCSGTPSETNCGAVLYIGVPSATLTSFTTTSITPASLGVGGPAQRNIAYTNSATTFSGSVIPTSDSVSPACPPVGFCWTAGAGAVSFASPGGWVLGWPEAALGAPVAADDDNFYWARYIFICNVATTGAWSISAPTLIF